MILMVTSSQKYYHEKLARLLDVLLINFDCALEETRRAGASGTSDEDVSKLISFDSDEDSEELEHYLNELISRPVQVLSSL